MVCLAAAVPVAAAADSYSITFDEASVKYMAPGEKGSVIVHAGVDRPGGNYSWVAAPSTGTIAPITGTSSAENFTLTYTAPSTPADVTIGITLTNGTASSNSTARYIIHVVKPITLTAQVKNSGNVSMQNVPVQFKVDDIYVVNTTFTIAANTTKTLTYNWTTGSLNNGEHTLYVTLDQNNTFVSFIDGSKTFSTKFFVGDSGFGLINILLTVVLVILMLILVFSYMNKGKRKKRT